MRPQNGWYRRTQLLFVVTSLQPLSTAGLNAKGLLKPVVAESKKPHMGFSEELIKRFPGVRSTPEAFVRFG